MATSRFDAVIFPTAAPAAKTAPVLKPGAVVAPKSTSRFDAVIAAPTTAATPLKVATPTAPSTSRFDAVLSTPKGVDPELAKRLAERGNTAEQISSLAPQKTSIIPSLPKASDVVAGVNKVLPIASKVITQPLAVVPMAAKAILDSKKTPGVDPALAARLKERGNTDEDIAKLAPKTTAQNYLPALAETVKSTFTEPFQKGQQVVRASSQLASTPFAYLLDKVTGGKLTYQDIAKTNVELAKKTLPKDVGGEEKDYVSQAAQDYLKTSGYAKSGKATATDIAVLGMLGISNAFGDPAYAIPIANLGDLAKKVGNTLKYKQVGQKVFGETAVVSPSGKVTPLKATEIPGATQEFKQGQLRMTFTPTEEGQVVIKGYKTRFGGAPVVEDVVSPQQLSKTIDNIARRVQLPGGDVLNPAIAKNIIKDTQIQLARNADPAVYGKNPLAQAIGKIDTSNIKSWGELYRQMSGAVNHEPGAVQTITNHVQSRWTPYITDVNTAAQILGPEFKPQVPAVAPTLPVPPSLPGALANVPRGTIPAPAPVAVPTVQSPAFEVGNKTSALDNVLRPKGTGETKISKLAQGVEAAAIEKKLTASLGELPAFQQMNLKEQAQLATDLLKTDPDRAVRIAVGLENAPNDVIPEAVFKAVEDQALRNADLDTIEKLANSDLTLQATAMGQRIRALGEREPNSPVQAIKAVREGREQALSKKLKQPIAAAKKQIAADIAREIPKVRKDDWDAFIRSIEC